MPQAFRPPATHDRWSDLASLPTGPKVKPAGFLAKALFARAVRRLPITVVVEEGWGRRRRSWGKGGPTMRIHDPEEFFTRLGVDGLIGLGESYLNGAWDCDDLAGLIAAFSRDLDALIPAPVRALRATWSARPPALHRGTKANSRHNIAHHYDLSNDLFALFLDESLTYSSALFDPALFDPAQLEVGPLGVEESLTTAQHRKIDRLLDAAQVGAGSRVLEIGTGWGELAIRAARRGAHVTSLTLSVEQQELARRRIAAAGFSDAVDVQLCDYRDARGEYDAVVSVEMIEAVGHEFLTDYFTSIDRLLRPGGRLGLQVISMSDARMRETKDTWTWIHKYIFPGGFLPSLELINTITHAHTRLREVDRLDFGLHYAETLRRWDEAFMSRQSAVLELGFDETFVRMWHFYLEYSRGGFASGYLDVSQVTFVKR